MTRERWYLIAVMMLASDVLTAAPRDFRLPDEYELAGTSSSAVLNTGAAVAGGVDAIRVNPALLALKKTYSVSAGYLWPTSGREIYRLGVVDSTTSKYAAAFSYLGFKGGNDPLETSTRDSQVLKRGSVAVAYPLQRVAISQ